VEKLQKKEGHGVEKVQKELRERFVDIDSTYTKEEWNALGQLADKQKAWNLDEIHFVSRICFNAATFEEAYCFTRTALKYLDSLVVDDDTREYLQATLYTNLIGRLLDGKYLDPYHLLQKRERDKIFKEYIQKALFLCTKNGWNTLVAVNLVRKGLFEGDDALVLVGFDSLNHRGETQWYHALKKHAKKYKESDINSRITLMLEKPIFQKPESTFPEGKQSVKVLSSNSDEYVVQLLHEIGVSRKLKGYSYLRDAILMSMETPLLLTSITGKLYPAIGAKHQSTAQRVERSIRTAIEAAWNKGDLGSLDSMYQCNIIGSKKKRPTNSEMIKLLVDLTYLNAKKKQT